MYMPAAFREDRTQPWAVDDAPKAFVADQLRAVTGLQVEIASVAGKWKASRNRSDADRAGVIAGRDLAGNALGRAISPGAFPVPR